MNRRAFLKGLTAGSAWLLAAPGLKLPRARAQRRHKFTVLTFGLAQRLLADFIRDEVGAKYGLEIEIKPAVDVRTLYTVLLAKGADFYFPGWLTLADLVARGQVKAKNIYASYLQDERLYVSLNSPVRTVSELKGKKVGAHGTAAGTSTQMLAVALKESYGLDLFKDLRVLFAAPPVIHKTLERGELAAAFNSVVAVPEILDSTKFRELMRPRDEWRKKTGVDLLIVTVATYDDVLKRDPEGVRNFLAARKEVVEIFQKDMEPALSHIRKIAGIKDEKLLRLTTENFVANFTNRWDEKVIESHKEFGRKVVEMFGKDKVAGIPDEAFTTAFNP